MSKKVNPTLIGAFVMGAIALAVAGILILSGGGFFEEHFNCVAFFEESITGLDIGAPVEFQGVRVGTVTDVRLIMDRAISKKIIRPVTFRLEGGRIGYIGDDKEFNRIEDGMEYLVSQGMRARLASQSMLTGKLKIELGLFPDVPVQRQETAISGCWQMPTALSPLRRMAAEVQELPLKEIVYDVHTAMKGISEIVTSESTQQAVDSTAAALKQIDQMAATINRDLEPMMKQAAGSLETMNQTMKQLQQMLDDVQPELEPFVLSATKLADQIGALLERQSPLNYHTQQALEEIARSARSLRYLTDYLERNPESLIRGKQ
ncbi:MAG: MlaD family protein [Kiritimatiellae bacterium]|nr:MlaD family protein [Kiritimatiellia bacterium]